MASEIIFPIGLLHRKVAPGANLLERRKAAFGLASVPFDQTSGSSIVAGPSDFGMWENRCQVTPHSSEQQPKLPPTLAKDQRN